MIGRLVRWIGLVCLVSVLELFAYPQSLRHAADQAGILIGSAVRPAQLAETNYASTLAREFNMVEAEDVMKWQILRPNPKTFDFRQGDELVRFAQAHRMKVRGHCLVWGRNNPDWLVHGHFTEQQLSHILRDHIFRVVRHYRGQVFAWDVVNEAMDENGTLRDSIWYDEPGIGLSQQGTRYIEQAFRWAHKADTNVLLFYNEAEGEGMNRKSDAIYTVIKGFKERGVPIDGVGLQMHFPSLEVNIADLSTNIARLTKLGLQVHITELDVSVPVDPQGNARPEDLARQANVYGAVVRVCLSNPGCTAIQTWGFTDKYSWIGSHSRGTRGQALPFDRSYKPKPAYHSMLEEISASGEPGH